MTEPKPIDWHDVAMVVFANGRPIIITTMEPKSLFETLANISRDDQLGDVADEDRDSEWYDQISVEGTIHDLSCYDFKLYSTEDAKAVFCARYGKEDEQEKKRPINQPLPGQLSLPLPE